MKSLKRLVIIIAFLFSGQISMAQDWTLDQSFTNPNNLTGVLRFGATVAIDGNTMVLGAFAENSNTGAAYVYVYDGTEWQFSVRLQGSDVMFGDVFGTSLDIEGDVIAIGATGADGTLSGAGAVYIWEKPVNGWETASTEDARLSSDLYANGQFGFRVDLRGNEILISAFNEKGAPSETNNNGAVYLYSKPSNQGWDKAIQMARFYYPSATSRPSFGKSISLQDDFIIISGQTSSSFNQGVVYVFEEPVSGWVDSQTPTAEFAKSTWVGADNFGNAVVATDDQVVISGFIFGTGGSAYVYNRPAAGWASSSVYTEDYSIISPYPANTDDNFGNHMSISKKRLVVGAFFDNGAGAVSSGRVYTYLLGETNSTFEREFISPNAVNQGFFGNRVSISGPNIVVGTIEGNEGNAYIFRGSYSENASDLFCSGSTYSFENQTITSPGTYNGTFTASDGLDSLVTLTLTQNPQLNFAFNIDPILCNGGTGGVSFDSPSGGDGGSYEYSVDGGATFQTSPVFTGLIAGAKTLVIRDGIGCTRTEGTSLTEPDQVSISSVQITEPLCNAADGPSTGSAVLQVTGGSAGYYHSLDGINYTYNGSGINTSITLSSLPVGDYLVYVKDGNDCLTTSSLSVVEPDALSMFATGTNPICAGESNGSITVSFVSGGDGGLYNYSLDSGPLQSSPTFSGLGAGQYFVNVFDGNQCWENQAVTLSDAPVLQLGVNSFTDITCFGEDDGSVTVTASGGQSPYQYSIDGSALTASNSFDNLTPGSHTIQVHDARGCIKQAIVFLFEPSSLSITTNTIGNSCSSNPNGQITVTATGGTPIYFVSLDNVNYESFNQSTTIESLDVGAYTVYVKDINECITSSSVSVGTAADNTAPTLTSSNSISLDENNGAVFYTAQASDDCAISGYSIVGGADQSLFILDVNDGSLRFSNAPDFENPVDNGANNVYDITISATDASSNSSSINLAITVNDLVEGIAWSGSVDSDWGSGSNWVGGIVPSLNDVAYIPAGTINEPIVSGDFGVNTLTVETGANLVVESESSLAIFGTVSGMGTVTMSKDATGQSGYSILGSPFEDVNLADLNADFLYAYDGTNYFVPSGAMTPGKGYFVSYQASTPILTLTGTPNSENVDVGLTTSGDGFNLVSNPYLAAIDRAAFVAANSGVIDGNIWLWNDGGSNVGSDRGGDYILVNNLGVASTIDLSDGVAGVKPLPSNNTPITSFQGFLVKANSSGNATFEPTMQLSTAGSNANGNFYRIHKSKGEIPKIKLSLSGEQNYGELLVGLSEDATNGVDYALDGPLYSVNQEFGFYTEINSHPYSIQALPLLFEGSLQVPLTTKVNKDGQYLLKVREISNVKGLDISLKNITTGVMTPLSDQMEIMLNLNTESQNNYSLVFSPSEVLSIDLKQSLTLEGTNKELIIKTSMDGTYSVNIYDLSGKIHFTENIAFGKDPSQVSVNLDQSKVYILQIGNQRLKFIIK